MKPDEIVEGGYYLADQCVLYVTMVAKGQVYYRCLSMTGQWWYWPVQVNSLNRFTSKVKGRVKPRIKKELTCDINWYELGK